MTAPNWTPCRVTLGALKPWAANPRLSTKAQAKRILASFQKFGQVLPVAIGPDNEVYDGHQRLSALLTVHGAEYEIDARRSSRPLTDDERRALVVTLHAGAVGAWNWDDLAGWDAAQLGEWGMDSQALKQWNTDAAALAAMLEAEKPAPVDAEPQIDRAEELRAKWGVEPGQLWRLGEHRLICGDCTDKAVVERVMGGEKAQLAFTSPPYAEQRKEQYGGTPEDEYWKWFDGVQDAIRESLNNTGNFVLNIKPNAKDAQRSLYVFDLVVSMVRERGWMLVDEFCWLRTGIPQQVVHRFKNGFEPCYWFVMDKDFVWYPRQVMHESKSVPLALGKGAGDTNAARRQGKGGGAIQGNDIVSGMAYPNNVLDFKQNAEALGHPAAFPVQLPAFFVESMTTIGECVYEPFSGSGTTIIACERLGRRCRAVEISPAYVAVALERWATATGGTPELVSDGSQ